MRKRRFHILAPNKATARPSRVIFFDTETNTLPPEEGESQLTLRMGWGAYVNARNGWENPKVHWFSFTTKEEFWRNVDACVSPQKKLYMVAHNVGFDWRIVGGFEHAESAGWTLKSFYNKNLTCLIRFKLGTATIQVLDTSNFFPMSLEKLGKVVGLDKLEVDFEKATDEELSHYCKRDVEILVKAWQKWLAFLDEHDLGCFRNTLPSTAFGGYRHRFMHTPIAIHANEAVCELERESYRGGRTECFKVGEFETAEYYQLDVNGMYAVAMQDQKYPHELRGYKKTLGIGALRNKLRNFSVIARVVIQTEQPVFPITHDGRNLYPIGTFEVVLSTPELKFALEYCKILEIKEIAWYRQTHIFKDFAEYFQEQKIRYEKEGNTAFRNIAKLMQNSLYGKFGQRGLNTTVHVNSSPCTPANRPVYDAREKKWCRTYGIGNMTVYEERSGEAYDSFPAIAAHVAAYCRMYLWDLFIKAGRENVFYCDTDSLIVNKKGFQNLKHLLHKYKLGYLKLEARGTKLTIHAPKDYALNDKVRIKGIRKNAVQLDNGVYEQTQFLGLAGAIRRKAADLVTIKRVTKRLQRKIYSGKVQPDGWVTPLHFPL